MKYFGIILLLVCLTAPSAVAFVARIDPHTEHRIHCHTMRAAVTEYILGNYTAGELADWLEATFLTPYGVAWSAEDTTDNSNLLTLINAASTDREKKDIADHVESLCVLWEDDSHVLDQLTKNGYRTRIGIATQ